MDFNIENLLDSARKIAQKGGQNTLKYFKKDIRIEKKPDSTPVTIADKESESVMREMIQSEFPEHGILGEEFGRVNENSPIQWILDPIDGTLSFIHGVPLYTTLIGIVVEDKPLIGIIYAPALDEICDAAIGLGARLNGVSCRVRDCKNLSDATLLTTEYKDIIGQGFESNYRKLIDQVHIHRSWGDAYGHMMVATGRADIMFDPVLNIWDAASLLPIVEEAGGSFTDVKGNARIDGGSALSCNKSLFLKVKTILNQ